MGTTKIEIGMPISFNGRHKGSHTLSESHTHACRLGRCPVSFLVRIIPGVHFATKTTITNNPFVCAHTLTSSSSSFYSSSDATVRLPLLAGGRAVVGQTQRHMSRGLAEIYIVKRVLPLTHRYRIKCHTIPEWWTGHDNTQEDTDISGS